MAVRTLRRTPLAGGFAALVGVAIVATVVLAVGLLTNTKAEPGGSGSAVGSRLASPSPPPPNNTFPNAAEQSLLGEIDPAIARLCERAPTSEYPKAALPGEAPITFPVQAGLRCALGGSQPDVVFLLRVSPEFTGAVTTEFYFGLRVSLAKAQAGDCATQDKASMKWSFGLRTGKLLCSTSPTRARIDWIFDGENVIARAERDDADRAALYQWWIDEGRVILH